MDSVLGLSITPNAVGLVLVEGELADGDIVDRVAFAVPADGTAAATRAADQVAAAVARTKQINAEHQLHGIGLTWSDDAAAEASLLLETLADNGFDHVVPLRLPQASEAFAQGIGGVLGYTRTAVCVVQSDGAIASLVDSRTADMRAASSDAVDHESLDRWLSELMVRASWQPEALVMVGTGIDLTGVSESLETVLGIPVFAPGEAELALARGAALACVRSQEFELADLDDYTWEPGSSAGPKRSVSALIGMGALAAGAVTFVASLAVAAGMQLTPDRDVQETANRAVSDSAQSAPEAPATAAAAPAPVLPEAPPPSPVVVEAIQEPQAPIVEVPEVLPEPEIPAPEQIYVPEEPVVAAPEPVYVPEAPVVAPPVVAAPPAAVPQVPAVEERPGFLTRIRDRISAIGDDPVPPVQVAPAPPVVPAPPP